MSANDEDTESQIRSIWDQSISVPPISKPQVVIVRLEQWRPVLVKKKLYVEGYPPSSNNASRALWRSSRVLSRVEEKVIGTKKKHQYQLLGPLSIPEANRGQTPIFIQRMFETGFPVNWEILVQHWIRFEEDQEKIHAQWNTLLNKENRAQEFGNMSAISVASKTGFNNTVGSGPVAASFLHSSGTGTGTSFLHSSGTTDTLGYLGLVRADTSRLQSSRMDSLSPLQEDEITVQPLSS